MTEQMQTNTKIPQKIENKNLKKQKSLMDEIQNVYYKSNYSEHNSVVSDNLFFIFIFNIGKISLQPNPFEREG